MNTYRTGETPAIRAIFSDLGGRFGRQADRIAHEQCNNMVGSSWTRNAAV
jgi:hypothetical protein